MFVFTSSDNSAYDASDVITNILRQNAFRSRVDDMVENKVNSLFLNHLRNDSKISEHRDKLLTDYKSQLDSKLSQLDSRINSKLDESETKITQTINGAMDSEIMSSKLISRTIDLLKFDFLDHKVKMESENRKVREEYLASRKVDFVVGLFGGALAGYLASKL
jgi:DNA-binding transcriptional MerR regulator